MFATFTIWLNQQELLTSYFTLNSTIVHSRYTYCKVYKLNDAYTTRQKLKSEYQNRWNFFNIYANTLKYIHQFILINDSFNLICSNSHDSSKIFISFSVKFVLSWLKCSFISIYTTQITNVQLNSAKILIHFWLQHL